jgi:class 3 adenylate cyclase/tetratricopeptide (TPR) repeat protein
MNCSACGHENPDRAKFCLECGAARALRCARCQTDLPPDAKFCLECGATTSASSSSSPAPAPAPAPPAREPRDYTPRHLADKILRSKSALEGERKHVTVLFADVKGSMELAERLDPEAWHRILERFFEILTEGVHRYEGTVNQYTGDGIMALFGAPIAHEDHAQRACRAALHLQDQIDRYSIEVKREHGVGFSTRMGINSGEVVVGRIGDDLRMDYTAQGHTVGLAQRMESLAEPNTCYVSDATAQLCTGYFSLDDLGEFSVKGASDPLRVFRLKGVGELRTRLDVALSRGLTRLVGRSDELQLLESALTRAHEDNAPVIGIVGEAGLGKSRLCFEFLERCRGDGLRTYETTGVSHGQSIPFLPMIRLFRAFFEVTDQEDDAAARKRLSEGLAAHDESVRDSLPLLFDFLGMPDPDHPAPRIDPEARQRQLIDLVRRVVPARRPNDTTVLLLEDLHWFDGGSAAFVEPLVEALQGTRTLVLLNFRPEYRAPWIGKSFYHQMPVSPLASESIGLLLDALLGSDPSLAGLAQLIHTNTGGNPFFAEEVVQNLIESGQLEGSRGNYRMPAVLDSLEVPSTVQALLASRMDRLVEREKDLLQTAAVIGREFDAPMLAAVVEEDEAELQPILRSLKDAEFVYERSQYPIAEYLFKHPLTHEVALNSQLGERRQRLHAQVARVIEAAHDDLDQQAALLAHHWESAGDAWQAAQWNERAAEWAGLRNAAEGMRHWKRAKILVRPLPHTEEALRLGVAACQGILRLGWRLGSSIDEATEAFEEGRRLAEENDDVEALAALHGTYGCVLGLVDGRADEYLSYARKAVELADRTDNIGLQLAERAYFGYASVFAAHMDDGIASCVDTCVRFPDDPGLGAEYTGYSPFLGVLNAHAWLLVRSGRLAEASAVIARAEKLVREYGDDEVQTWLQLPSIEADIFRDDSVATREHAEVAVSFGEKSRTPQSRQVGQMVVGVMHRLNGNWDEAIATLEEALHGAATGANREFEGWSGAELALALLARGDLDRAEDVARTAVDVARGQNSRGDEVRASLALAQTQIKRGSEAAQASAESVLERAQAMIAETGVFGYQPDVHKCRAMLAKLRGEESEAERESECAVRLLADMEA